ncbi:hypothetical protein T440DRAFT_518760 [Plenodomus tracheiphilus IPT5]|uniref:Uncharacterized protein n=1 Tax=Plenodomus tracheiphilus IPT5 TaxID=1408161 RepID=A0A6A7B3M0_9PLEO|nr:hypothetical protein T440DRAFT_518760 [Plenodomus tracheiphilus IPT5]
MAIAYESPFGVEDEALFNIDALVNDDDGESMRGPPLTPLHTQLFEQPRRATPSIPPGFTAPAIPRAVMDEPRSRPGSRPMSRTTSSTITPAVPVVPITPKQVASPMKTKKSKQKSDDAESAKPVKVTAENTQPETPSKATTKAGPPKSKTPNEVVKKTKEAASDPPKSQSEENKPAFEVVPPVTPKAKTTSRRNKSVNESTPKSEDVKSIPAPAAVTPSSTTYRQPLSKLDIATATKMPPGQQTPATSSSKVDLQSKNARPLTATSATSVPSSPAATATGSPIKRSVAPRTLRVVPTSKAETPPPAPIVTTPLPQIPTVDKLRSRQASVASLNPPGTPASEMISDTASVASTSFSRANSPPPVGGKVGTAPVRKKTKSQAKKDRQDRKRQIEEEQTMLEEQKSDLEVVQAPIIGRKKKEKKPSSAPPKSIAAAFRSQPASPKPATVEEEQYDAPTPVSRKASSVKVSARETPEPEPERIQEPSKEKREHTAQTIMADLQRTGELLASSLEFFKPLSSSLTHASRNSQSASAIAPPDLKIHFSEADLKALANKKPVRIEAQDGRPDSRTLITPGGKFLWGLSEELEAKALELEQHIEELKGAARFHPRKQTSHAFNHNIPGQAQSNDVLPAITTALKEAGRKLNTNSGQQMPKMDPTSGLLGSTNHSLPPVQAPDVSVPQQPVSQQQTPADAGQYLNQFVLPKTDNPPPNQPRPEMAAVGGPPGAGTANISVNVNKFAKAAKAVVEGGAVGSTELDGMGVMASDLLGGVFVQGLEALVGAGLGLYPGSQDFGVDGNGNITLGRGGGKLDVQGLMNAIESTAGMGGYGGNARRGRGSVLSMEEAEQAMLAAKKEHDVLEKKLAALMKKNRKLALGTK